VTTSLRVTKPRITKVATKKEGPICPVQVVHAPIITSAQPRQPSAKPAGGAIPPRSGRALARAALGREFPISTLSMVERVPSIAWQKSFIG
jgi:hypothetical protein